MLKGLSSLYPSPAARVSSGLADLYGHLPEIESAIHLVTRAVPFDQLRDLYVRLCNPNFDCQEKMQCLRTDICCGLM